PPPGDARGWPWLSGETCRVAGPWKGEGVREALLRSRTGPALGPPGVRGSGEPRDVQRVEGGLDVLQEQDEIEDREAVRLVMEVRVERGERRSRIGDELGDPGERDALRDRRLDGGEVGHERLAEQGVEPSSMPGLDGG